MKEDKHMIPKCMMDSHPVNIYYIFFEYKNIL